jgi:dTDP-glucose 4,6-dehydratase
MHILITGGAGFIGSNFVNGVLLGRYPALSGARVVVLDKLGYAASVESLKAVMDDPRFRLVRGDITDEPLVRDLMAGVDLVVHFAAETHVDRSITGPGEFVRTNVLGTQTLLQSALEAEVRKFVHVSTDEVYGSIGEGWWREHAPLEPNSPYSASKASADLLARAYHRTYGMNVCVTRCSNNYGKHQFPEKVIPLFVTNLLEGRKVPLYGDGSNVREWLHVDDHCRALALVAERGRAGEVYNIGGGAEFSNRRLTEMILEIMGMDWSMVRPVEDRKGHDFRYALDFSKASAELGYTPAVHFPDGLAETVQWYVDNRDWWLPLKRRLPEPAGRA